MDLNSFIFPAPKKRQSYSELDDLLLWVPVYQKNFSSEFKAARMSTEMNQRAEPAAVNIRLPSTKQLPVDFSPGSNRKLRPSLIFSSRENREREEPRAGKESERKPEQRETLFRNAYPSFQQATCPAMRARFNLTRLKMSEAKLIAFPSNIQLNLAGRKKLQATFPIKNVTFRKGALVDVA